jgi:hypothetical protein
MLQWFILTKIYNCVLLGTCFNKKKENGSCVEGLQSHSSVQFNSHTVLLVQCSTHLLPVMRDLGSNPRGALMWNSDSPVSVVLLHWWPLHDWSLWPCLRWTSSRTVTRPSCWQCGNPTWSHTAILSRFHAWIVGCWGGALWRACNLTAFIHSSTGPVVHPFASCHEGPRFKPKGGTYVKPGFLVKPGFSC